MEGVRVTLGRLPGSTTLKGLIRESNTKLCSLWLIPTPVFPAIVAGSHPPLGVMETTQPSASAASTVVVPRHKRSIYSSSKGLVDCSWFDEEVTSCLGTNSPLFFSVGVNLS